MVGTQEGGVLNPRLGWLNRCWDNHIWRTMTCPHRCLGLISTAMKALSQALIVCLLAAAVQSQASVSFCDLVRSPEKYDGKVVSIRATYRYGFEWQQLYCIDCLDRGKAWLEIPPDLDNTSDKALRRAPKGAGIVNLTVQGVFVSGGRFGHMNRYPYKFVGH